MNEPSWQEVLSVCCVSADCILKAYSLLRQGQTSVTHSIYSFSGSALHLKREMTVCSQLLFVVTTQGLEQEQDWQQTYIF